LFLPSIRLGQRRSESIQNGRLAKAMKSALYTTKRMMIIVRLLAPIALIGRGLGALEVGD